MRLLYSLPPKPLRSLYHLALALAGALWHRFPARSLTVIGVTGTKGKTTVTELISAILEEAGYTVALSNGVRFKIGGSEERNLSRMTMPGRFFLERFLRRALSRGATHAVIEMTSEGAAQHRHRFLALDALVFTNLAPEHIESHGSFAAYRDAKLSIARALARSRKKTRVIVANADDAEGERFLAASRPAEQSPFSLKDTEPYEIQDDGITFTFGGHRIRSPLVGVFNLSNILAAATLARGLDIRTETIARAIASFAGVPGRMEYIREGQSFDVVVDYAHTPDSLRNVYAFLKESISNFPAFAKTSTSALASAGKQFPISNKISNDKSQISNKTKKLICVLGATGGGRDKWKRPEMGRIAAEYCDHIILTNEDPYDEDPNQILAELESGISNFQFPISKHVHDTKYKVQNTHEKILDRRLAIRTALGIAQRGDTIIITGKGSDPSICGPRGTKEPWSDAVVAREELARLR